MCCTLFGGVPPVLCFWSMELNPLKMISAQNGLLMVECVVLSTI